VAETRPSVHVHCMQCQTAQFLNYALECQEAWQNSKFPTEGVLTLEAFADNANTILGTDHHHHIAFVSRLLQKKEHRCCSKN